MSLSISITFWVQTLHHLLALELIDFEDQWDLFHCFRGSAELATCCINSVCHLHQRIYKHIPREYLAKIRPTDILNLSEIVLKNVCDSVKRKASAFVDYDSLVDKKFVYDLNWDIIDKAMV